MTPQRPAGDRSVGPQKDDEVAPWAAALGLPGLIDIHVHFMPRRVLDKVWGWFDSVRFADGSGWPIRYRMSDEQRVAHLRGMGVQRFTALSYPHRPGMAAWLNDWAYAFAAQVPECVPSATFYPEPEAPAYVDAAIERGARVFKAHIAVGGYDPRDPLLEPVWAQLSARALPVVVHTGSGPQPTPFTGPVVFSEVMERHPGLTAVVAHMGAPEHGGYLDLVDRYPRLHLDTTMAFTGFFTHIADFDDTYLERLADHGDRIVLGSDFPNIPYPYAQQVAALVALGFGDDWLRAVCHDNAAALLERASRGV